MIAYFACRCKRDRRAGCFSIGGRLKSPPTPARPVDGEGVPPGSRASRPSPPHARRNRLFAPPRAQGTQRYSPGITGVAPVVGAQRRCAPTVCRHVAPVLRRGDPPGRSRWVRPHPWPSPWTGGGRQKTPRPPCGRGGSRRKAPQGFRSSSTWLAMLDGPARLDLVVMPRRASGLFQLPRPPMGTHPIFSPPVGQKPPLHHPFHPVVGRYPHPGTVLDIFIEHPPPNAPKPPP